MAVPARPDDLDLRSGFDWLNTAVAMPADRLVLISTGVAAVMTDVAVRAGGVGVGGGAFIVICGGSVAVVRLDARPIETTIG